MNLSLTESMKEILESGFNLITAHSEAIKAEWEAILSHLRQQQVETAEEFGAAVHLFATHLFSRKYENIEELLCNIERAMERAQHSFTTNRAIFMITLLENAVHKAIKSGNDHSYQNHQAVKYLFSKISEHMIVYPYSKRLDIDGVLEQLVHSQQLPIEWAAIVTFAEQQFKIQKMIGTKKHPLPQEEASFQYDTLFQLTESLLQGLPSSRKEHRNIVPIPWDEGTLLICTYENDSSSFLPFLSFTLDIHQIGVSALQSSRREQQWKDAVILFNEWIMRSQNTNDAIKNISTGFVNYLPFERCALFSYSYTDHNSAGLFGYHFNNEAIQSIKENTVNVPLIHSRLKNLQPLKENLQNLQPIYASDASDGFPVEYVEQFQLASVVVAPIYVPSQSKLIGAAILDQGPGKHFKVSRETLTALMKFGQSAGELLVKFDENLAETANIRPDPVHVHFSAREIDVLKLLADGASTSEAAERLSLSEYTVRDYVSEILRKLKARNRTEATTRAIRSGIIA